MWLMGDIVRYTKKGRKIDFRKVRYGCGVYYCLLSIYASVTIFERGGAKICVEHQISFLVVLEG